MAVMSATPDPCPLGGTITVSIVGYTTADVVKYEGPDGIERTLTLNGSGVGTIDTGLYSTKGRVQLTLTHNGQFAESDQVQLI